MIFKRRWKLISLIVAFFPLLISFTPPQEARVNQKKIEKERVKKEKESKRQYDKAVKRHHNMQTKETKARMKQTKKESKSATPIQH
jgi:hypothetical protein